MEERRFCSQMNDAEPLAGTADTVGVWLLLEYRPVWKARSQSDNDLAPRTRAWLAETQAELARRGVKSRPQFIRQPEVDSGRVRFLLGLPDRLVEFSGVGYDFLEALDVAALVGGAVQAPDTAPTSAAGLASAAGSASGAGLAQSTGQMLTAPQYFVCTNGQRDVCCARFGLPLYTALRERVGERVWQITHLGGHRFAPNVLVLPQGALYGRVAPDDAGGFVAAVESGALAFPHLRGRTVYPKAVQAAEAFAGRSDLRLLHVDGDEARARVRFAAADAVIEVSVERSATGVPVMASCGDASAELVHPYRRA